MDRRTVFASGRNSVTLGVIARVSSANGGPELMQYLIDNRADIDAREKNGLTILGWARKRAMSDEFYGAIVNERLGATE